MTCIAAYRDEKTGVAIVGADSAGSDGHRITLRKDKKLFQRKGIIFGYTSSYRMGQILQYEMKIPKRWCRSVEKYLINSLVPSAHDAMKKGNFLKTSNQGVSSGGTFIIAIDGRIFTIYDDFQVSEPDDPFCTCGSGCDFSMGALRALEAYNIDPEDRVKMAITAASKSCTTVGGDIHIETTNKSKVLTGWIT